MVAQSRGSDRVKTKLRGKGRGLGLGVLLWPARMMGTYMASEGSSIFGGLSEKQRILPKLRLMEPKRVTRARKTEHKEKGGRA